MDIKKRCDVCKGERRVTGMGGMRVACDGCKGSGFVVQVENKKKKG